MLAVSPLFPSPYGWPLEDLITKDCDEANSNRSVLDFPSFDQIPQGFSQENSSSSGGGVNGGTGDDTRVAKKLNHNASERDRRKRVNNLYAFLRSLLPISSDRKKKVSIPGIVSRTVKYIPELQNEVDTLLRKKEKLRSNSSSKEITQKEGLGIKKQSPKDAKTKAESSVVSSVSVLGEKEAVIQLISSSNRICKNKNTFFLSRVLEYLEQEEDGLILLNASTFRGFGEGTLLNTLHIQVQGNHKIEAEKLKEKLSSFHQPADEPLNSHRQ